MTSRSIDKMGFWKFLNSLRDRRRRIVKKLIKEMKIRNLSVDAWWEFKENGHGLIFELEWNKSDIYASVEFYNVIYDEYYGNDKDIVFDTVGEVGWLVKNRNFHLTHKGCVGNAIDFPNMHFLKAVDKTFE